MLLKKVRGLGRPCAGSPRLDLESVALRREVTTYSGKDCSKQDREACDAGTADALRAETRDECRATDDPCHQGRDEEVVTVRE